MNVSRVSRQVLLALAAVAAGACHHAGVGGACNDSSDCQSGLICSPNGTCVDPNTDGGPGTDATGPGTDATGPGTDATGPGTDAAGGGTDAAGGGTDAAPGAVSFCMTGSACTPGDVCHTAECSRTMEGFCTEASRPTCGGIAGLPCPSGMFSSCLNQVSCGGADMFGFCVTPEERMMICAMQPTLWECP